MLTYKQYSYIIVVVFIFYLLTKHHIPNSSGSLVITVNMKAKWKFPHYCHNALHSTKNYFKKSNIYYHISFHNLILCGTNVAPTSQVSAATMLTLPIARS